MREHIAAALFAVAAVFVAVGIALVAVPLAWIIGGLLLAGWTWLVFGDLQGLDEVPE